MDDRSTQREFEDQFLRQLRARAINLAGSKLPADEVVAESTNEGVDSTRAELSRLGVYDTDLFESLPGLSSLQLRFRKKILGGLVNTTKVRLRARVLVDTAALVEDRAPAPMGREDVRLAMARYEVLPRGQKPSAVVLASPTGFTEDAKRLIEGTEPTLILIGGRDDGGWDISVPQKYRKSPWARLFDLETRDDRIRRLQYHLEQAGPELDSRGISIESLGEKMGLGRLETEALVRRACRQDARLMTVAYDGRQILTRSPFADKGSTMSIWSRLKRLLGLKPSTSERIRELNAQRIQLENQRGEEDHRVDTLETQERELLKQGAAAETKVEKQQLAGKMVRVRRDLKRVKAQQQLLTQQLNIISTQMHNLTMAEQGKRVDLPKAEDLTTAAAEAEQVVSELAANADLAQSIEVAGETPMMNEEQDAIMAEFEELAGTPEPEASSTTSAPEAGEAAPEPDRAAARRKADGESARPEMS